MQNKEKKELLDWISVGKELFPVPPPGFFQFMKKEGLDRNDLYTRMSDQAIVFLGEVLKAEEEAKKSNEPFAACHMTEIVFPDSRGDDVM